MTSFKKSAPSQARARTPSAQPRARRCAPISKLETGEIPNHTIGTLRTYATALGRKLAWTLQVVGDH